MNNLKEIYQKTKENNNFLIHNVNDKETLVASTPNSHQRTIFKRYKEIIHLTNPLFIAQIMKINDEKYYLNAFYFYQNENETHPDILTANYGEICMDINCYLYINNLKNVFQYAMDSFFQSEFHNNLQIKTKIIKLPTPRMRTADGLPSYHQMSEL